MATMWVYADTVRRAQCKGPTCGARITWAELCGSRRWMAFDGVLVTLRTQNAYECEDGRVRWEVDLSDVHVASCPDRGFLRRARETLQRRSGT